MREFSPLMLAIARESRKMSQTALAKAAGISQSAVSQMESGVIAEPTDRVVAQLAEALRYTPTVFYASIRFQQLPITFFRKRRMGVKDVSAIRARVNLFRLRVETLLKASEYEGPRIALADLQSDDITPPEAAQRLRLFWNVPAGPILDLTSLVESFGIVIVPMDFGTRAVDGLSIYEPSDSLPPMIFLNDGIPADRWRLTLAHELGHIALHHHLNIPPSHEPLEDEAFDFAAEFLAPAREIAGQLVRVDMHRLALLKRHWRVSMASLLMRAQKMGRLNKRDAKWLWIQLGPGGKNEPVEIAPERATFLRSLVEYHLNRLDYSARDLSAILHMSPEELRSDFGLLPAPLRLA